MEDVKSGAKPQRGDDGPQSSLGFLLSQLGFVSSRRWHQTLAPLGIEPRHFLLLRFVARSEGQSQQSIGQMLHIPPSRIVALVDQLEERGLLERRANPSDRRARALYLTPRGRRVLDKVWKLAMSHEQRLGSSLTPEEREQLITLLQKLAAEEKLVPGVHPGLTSAPWPS